MIIKRKRFALDEERKTFTFRFFSVSSLPSTQQTEWLCVFWIKLKYYFETKSKCSYVSFPSNTVFYFFFQRSKLEWTDFLVCRNQINRPNTPHLHSKHRLFTILSKKLRLKIDIEILWLFSVIHIYRI